MGSKQQRRKNSKSAQTWSIDLIVGVIIFMLVLATFYAFMSSKTELSLEELKYEGSIITSRLLVEGTEESLLTTKGYLSRTKYDELCKLEYQVVKSTLGIAGDVCIFLEDENGNVIPCANGRAGIGNAKDINLTNNLVCGQFIP